MSSDSGELAVLFLTANVGTLFEKPDRLLTPWLNQFCTKVSREQPDFVALHCQEVGGKTFVTGMKHVQPFVDTLLEAPELAEYSRIRGYFDEDYETKTEFTALGNVYFVHSRVSDAAMWDFSGSRFHPIADKEVCRIKIDNLRQDTFHKKMKYPPDFFPQFPWSRKGHIVTRWRLRNRVLDIVNVHLFHDASNLESVSQSPSIYVANRCRALKHTLQQIRDLGLSEAPLFIFGDFNFRLDLKAIVDEQFEGAEAHPEEKNDAVESISYCTPGSDVPLLTLAKKTFSLKNPMSPTEMLSWRTYDREPAQFTDLFEQSVAFPPSYPFSEDVGITDEYMETRPPSWCDRILCNSAGDMLMKQASSVVYNLVGADDEMGDHKPVFLSAVLPAATVAGDSHPVAVAQTTKVSSVGNNSNNNHRVADSHAAGQSNNAADAADEPSAKRVNHAPCPPGGSTMDGLVAAGWQMLLAHWPLLAIGLLYCCTLLLLQFVTGLDCDSALVILIVLAASVSRFLQHR